jgi:hypothetical protein
MGAWLSAVALGQGSMVVKKHAETRVRLSTVSAALKAVNPETFMIGKEVRRPRSDNKGKDL